MKRLFLILILVVILVAAVSLLNEGAEDDVAVPETEEENAMQEQPTAPVPTQQNAMEEETDDTCGKKNTVCEVSNDCCRNLGLECQEVTLTSGSTEKRCMPFAKTVCTIACQENGTWGRAEFCKTTTVPTAETPDCATLTGTCDRAPNEERNSRKCWKS